MKKESIFSILGALVLIFLAGVIVYFASPEAKNWIDKDILNRPGIEQTLPEDNTETPNEDEDKYNVDGETNEDTTGENNKENTTPGDTTDGDTTTEDNTENTTGDETTGEEENITEQGE